MKSIFLFIVFIVCIIQTILCDDIGNIFFPRNYMRIEIPLIGKNINIYVKNCRFHYERSRVYCDWDYDKTYKYDPKNGPLYAPYNKTYLSIPVIFEPKITVKPGIIIKSYNLKKLSDENTDLIAETSFAEIMEVGDTYNPSGIGHIFDLETNQGNIKLLYLKAYVCIY